MKQKVIAVSKYYLICCNKFAKESLWKYSLIIFHELKV